VFLVDLANMARASCTAEITVDCTSGNALSIQPLTE
jgi:hypothetical protein